MYTASPSTGPETKEATKKKYKVDITYCPYTGFYQFVVLHNRKVLYFANRFDTPELAENVARAQILAGRTVYEPYRSFVVEA